MGLIAINKTVPTPGAPVKLYQPGPNFPVCGSNGTQIQADPSNAGKLYIGTKGLTKGTTTLTRLNVIAILTAGQFWPSSGGFGGIDPEQVYLDVDTANDGALAGISG